MKFLVCKMMYFVQPKQNIIFFILNFDAENQTLKKKKKITSKWKQQEKKKKKSFPFPKPQKPNICTILWMAKTPFLAASAAAVTEWSHITLCWWEFHSQTGRRSSLVRAKQTSLVHWINEAMDQGFFFFFWGSRKGGLLMRYFGTTCN